MDKILLVDDDAMILKDNQTYFRSAGNESPHTAFLLRVTR